MYCNTCVREIPRGRNCPFCGSELSREPTGEVSRDRLIGKLLDGRYRIDGRIGEGAMAVVYRAHHMKLDRDIAVKILKPTTEGELVKRFEREAKIVSRLTSPHTVRVFDYGESNGVLYIAMEFLSGKPLDTVLAEEGRLSAARTLRFMRQVCHALEEAHAFGMIHRDLKPANIFIDARGGDETVRVLDFGITRIAEGSEDLGISVARITMAGIVMGTPTYMAPEQAQDQPLDARTDLYALGVVAYHCLAGKPPFVGSPGEVVFHHSISPPPPLTRLSPPLQLDPRIEALVMQLLAKNPDLRPKSAAELGATLDGFLAGKHGKSGSSTQPRYALWGAIAMGGALLALGVGHQIRSRSPSVRVEALSATSAAPDGFFDVPLGE